VPGVLRDINNIVSDLHANIERQVLSTDPDIGYMVMDLGANVSEEVRRAVSALPANIRTRILY
jgi:D-3-phosphoglycerate dehydrogenase